MSDHKFLSDGRKVALVGKLNNEEWIVQEVFVNQSGDEIPSGERFTAKSLHDAPVESFKDKEIRRKELRIKELESDYDKLQQNLSQAKVDAQVESDIRKSLNAMAVNCEGMETLRQFLCGEIRWLVNDVSYSLELPKPFNDAVKDVDCWAGRRRYEGIKLISMFGKANGDFAFQLNRYRDGSGNYTEIKPFNSFEGAARYVVSVAVDRARNGNLSPSDCQKLLDSKCMEHVSDSERSVLLSCFRKAIANREEAKARQVAEVHKRIDSEIASFSESLKKYEGKS